jgi:hypothetical protein
LTAKVGGDFDLICGTGKGKIGLKAGPVQVGADSDGAPSAGVGGEAGAQIEGKVALKGCAPPAS